MLHGEETLKIVYEQLGESALWLKELVAHFSAAVAVATQDGEKIMGYDDVSHVLAQAARSWRGQNAPDVCVMGMSVGVV